MSLDSELKAWRQSARRARRPELRRKYTRRVKYTKLKIEVDECRDCPLGDQRTCSVPLDNWRPCAIALVGEAPGRNEDEKGRPFVGRSGKLLDGILGDLGAKRKDVVVMNTLACRPPQNRDPKPDETKACRPLYEKQLDFSGAWIVVLMGNKALAQEFPGKRITSMRGKPLWKDGRIYLPTFHPAYVLRNPKAKKKLVEDLQLALDIYRGVKWWPPITRSVIDDSKHPGLHHQLEHQGWAMIYSRRLEDDVIVTRDEAVDVPAKHSGLVRYAVQELIRMGELGKGPTLSVGELAAIHLVKTLGGTVVQ